jgi:hypothetical protein
MVFKVELLIVKLISYYYFFISYSNILFKGKNIFIQTLVFTTNFQNKFLKKYLLRFRKFDSHLLFFVSKKSNELVVMIISYNLLTVFKVVIKCKIKLSYDEIEVN